MLNEPRGGVFRHVNLLVPAVNPDADQGWIIMEPQDTPPMSGSNSMCVATVLLETGIIEMSEPETHLTLEAPGGLIKVRAFCSNGPIWLVSLVSVREKKAKSDAFSFFLVSASKPCGVQRQSSHLPSLQAASIPIHVIEACVYRTQRAIVA